MADQATLAKARRELEELYLGIPDDSVNLTFGDLAEVKPPTSTEKRKSGPMEAISEVNPKKEETSPLTKLPSLDFSRGLDETIPYQNNHHRGSKDTDDSFRNHRRHHHVGSDGRQASPGPHGSLPVAGFRHGVERSMHSNYDEMSNISGMSTVSTMQGGGRRRPGIPHSNICTVCSNYIYICRHRCLVCGRAYCRQCVSIGMGEMTEGRKCIECLGRRFSQRYIQRAGRVGCCVPLGYPSAVMQQEIKWAEKGPRRTRERRYNQGTMMSRSRSPVTPRTPITPRTPTRAHLGPNSTPPSFVMNSPYSAYSPTNHPLPF